MIAYADTLLAGFMSPLPRLILWGTLSGAISMAIYACIAPKQKMTACKACQKEVRAKLLQHEGSFGELRTLIRQDFYLSLALCAFAIPAVIISFLPAAGILYCLLPAYESVTLPSPGPEWTDSAEFWYILSACISSLGIKFLFRIT